MILYRIYLVKAVGIQETREIGLVKKLKDCSDVIAEFLLSHNYIPSYFICNEMLDGLCIDIGSRIEFFKIVPVVHVKVNN